MNVPATPILKGRRIILRGLLEEDRPVMTGPRSPDFLRMVGIHPHETTNTPLDTRNTAFDEALANPLHWAIMINKHCIGSAFLHSLNEHDKRASYAIGIVDPDDWDNGFGTESTGLVLDYAFRHLHLHRIAIRVLSYNKRAIRCYEKCGFKKEGIERETAFVNQQWHDDLIMGILAHEFRPPAQPG